MKLTKQQTKAHDEVLRLCGSAVRCLELEDKVHGGHTPLIDDLKAAIVAANEAKNQKEEP